MARRWSYSVRDPWQNSENLLECGADIASGQRNEESCKIEHGKTRIHMLQWILSFHVPKRPVGLRGLGK